MQTLLPHALAHLYGSGAVIIPPSRDPGATVHVPFALLPRKLPAKAYEKAVALAEPFNVLVDAVARKPEWLISVLERTGAGDVFTGRLLALLKEVLAENGGAPPQPIYFGIHRSDYMIDGGQSGTEAELRQIELNTISSAFAGLSSKIAELHKYLAQRFPAVYAANGLAAAALPPNACLISVAAAIAEAHKAYGKPESVVAFVVQPGERNIMDQRLIEHLLWKEHGVAVQRVTLADLARIARLREGDKALLLQSDEAVEPAAEKTAAAATAAAASGAAASASHPASSSSSPSISSTPSAAHSGAEWREVSVVYYRSGYSPADYPSENEWAGRTLAERSVAIKCPSVAYHLCGTKKVQQVLAQPGQLELFVTAEICETLRGCFAGLWSLDPAEATEESRAAIERAKEHPNLFVVKPQREGGGNNLFGPAVAAALGAPAPSTAASSSSPSSTGEAAATAAGQQQSLPMTAEELAAHILMERVFPQSTASLLVKQGAITAADAVSELGIYGIFIGDGKTVYVNKAGGHLLRTKIEGTDEGGVAAGFAVLDSPALL